MIFIFEHFLNFSVSVRSSDKRKNMAAQKLQAQRRLLRPTKRADGDASIHQKKQQSVVRKKEELVHAVMNISRRDYIFLFKQHFS